MEMKEKRFVMKKLTEIFHETNRNHGRKRGQDGYTEYPFINRSIEEPILEKLMEEDLIHRDTRKYRISPTQKFWALGN